MTLRYINEANFSYKTLKLYATSTKNNGEVISKRFCSFAKLPDEFRLNWVLRSTVEIVLIQFLSTKV